MFTDSTAHAPDPEVIGELQEMKDRLLQQSWLADAQDREGFEVGAVADKSSKHIQELTGQDNIYSLADRYHTAAGRKKGARFRHSPRRVRLTAAIPLALLIATIVLAILVSPFWYFGLYIVCLAAFIPLYAFDRWQKNAGFTRAAADAAKATTDVEKAVRSLIERSAREVTAPKFTDPATDVLTMGEGTGLSSRASQADRIATRYRANVELHLLRPGGATVGITGERGIGKSELLRSFCDTRAEKATTKSGGTIQVLVPVPSAFRGIEFLALVAQELARAVPGYRTPEEIRLDRRKLVGGLGMIIGFIGLGASLAFIGGFPSWTITPLEAQLLITAASLALIVGSTGLLRPGYLSSLYTTRTIWARGQLHRDAEALALRLRYAETISSQNEGSVSLKGIGLKHTGQRSLSSLPLTEAALVTEISTLANKLSYGGYRIIVGIDEMDKLEAGQATDEFLNTVKQLFSVKSCSFIVSVSSSAWAKFVRRGINLRDALDSSLDVIESIDAFDFKEVRNLILHRRVKMTDSQILFCFILSGGLPREAMRFARSLVARNRDEEGSSHKLAVVAGLVLDGEVKRLIDASKVEAADLPDLDRAVMLRKCDYLYQWWRSGPDAEPSAIGDFAWLGDDSFLWTGGKLSGVKRNLRGEAHNSFARLELMFRFLMLVSDLFCVKEEGDGISKYSGSQTAAIGNKLATIRRVMEGDTLGADRALRDVSAELKKANRTKATTKQEASADGDGNVIIPGGTVQVPAPAERAL